MTLDFEEIKILLKKVTNAPQWIVDARNYHKDMKSLLYGDDFKELILRIEHIETEKKAKARNKYSRPIKDINEKLLQPVGNVYSATGGGKVYDIKSDNEKSKFLKKITNIRGGYSLEKWLETFWSKDLYNADPNGLLFIEWNEEDAYPTYKSIDIIQYYESNGQKIKFVVFKPKNIGDYLEWRVVDGEKEYRIKDEGGKYEVIEEIEHLFGECPAVVISDIHRIGEKIRLAPIDPVVDNEKELLRDRSILTIHKFLNGFSTPYRPALICSECHGVKKIGENKCESCDGKGYLLGSDVVDEIILPVSMDADESPTLPTNFAGYISPDLEIWNQYIAEEKRMFDEIFESVWGTRETEAKDQTATGIILNTQPMTSRLNKWSNVAQNVEGIITEMLANFYLIKDKDERIANITYGRNYVIQPPEFLLEQYQKSKEKNDAATILDRKLTEYLTSKYKNDPSTLRIELLKKDLEPYIHYDIKTVKDIYGQEEAQKKGYFTDWWETLTNNDFNSTTAVLEKKRDDYLNERILNINNSPTGEE